MSHTAGASASTKLTSRVVIRVPPPKVPTSLGSSLVSHRAAFWNALSWPVSLSRRYKAPAVHAERVGAQGRPRPAGEEGRTLPARLPGGGRSGAHGGGPHADSNGRRARPGTAGRQSGDCGCGRRLAVGVQEDPLWAGRPLRPSPSPPSPVGQSPPLSPCKRRRSLRLCHRGSQGLFPLALRDEERRRD